MNNLSVINISGIDCYERNGTAYLKLDTVARGLGFTQEKGGVEYVRWETFSIFAISVCVISRSSRRFLIRSYFKKSPRH